MYLIIEDVLSKSRFYIYFEVLWGVVFGIFCGVGGGCFFWGVEGGSIFIGVGGVGFFVKK